MQKTMQTLLKWYFKKSKFPTYYLNNIILNINLNSWPEKIGNIVIHSCLWTDCIYSLFRIRTEIQSHKFNKAKTLT